MNTLLVLLKLQHINVLFALIAAFLGWTWGQSWLLVLSILMCVVWDSARNRNNAGLFVLIYYLSASRNIPEISESFFSDLPKLYGYLMWFGASVLNALPWFVFWHQNRNTRLRNFIFIIIISILPPLGLIGWTNPLIGSGILFPGLNLIGLFFTIGLMLSLIRRHKLSILFFVTVSVVSNASTIASNETNNLAQKWIGINSHFSQHDSQGERLSFLARTAYAAKQNQVLVLPESTLKFVEQDQNLEVNIEQISEVLMKKNALIVLGVELNNKNEQKQNAIAVIGSSNGQHRYFQRIPVPVAMWVPFSEKLFPLNLVNNAIANINDKRIAYFICYEQLLTYPAIISMTFQPELILGVSNAWWVKNTVIANIQEYSMKSWARLMNRQVVLAVNS